MNRDRELAKWRHAQLFWFIALFGNSWVLANTDVWWLKAFCFLTIPCCSVAFMVADWKIFRLESEE